MRPQITFPKSLKRALNYHEKKVQKGVAKLLHAHSFFKLPQELNFHEKEGRFKDLMGLNNRSETKLIHISLNFHPSEKERLDEVFLIHLADEYMSKIGFGDQPYLVYQHEDAGHPHIHVLSPLIQENGKRIPTHFIAKNVSEPVRKKMEKQYGFIPADKKEQLRQDEKQLAVTPQKIQAGKSATMRGITNVLDHVIDRYKYTSLNELNTILRLYNVKADRGAENSRTYKNRGLTYVVIDKDGKTLTKPVKASAFHNKPTLDYIEGKFKENEQKRLPDQKHISTSVDWAIQSKASSLNDLAKSLKKDRIDLVIRRSEQGRVFGITYIDHQKKTVFNGSDLSKEYAAKRILERLEKNQTDKQKTDTLLSQKHVLKEPEKMPKKENEKASKEISKGTTKIIEQVVEPDGGESWAINKEMLTEEQRKKKKGFTKQWEM